jgi:hypothetical protein
MEGSRDKIWIKIPCSRDFRKKFKMLCWAENTSMTDKILGLMEEEIKDNQSLIQEVENEQKE